VARGIEELLAKLETEPQAISFVELRRVCEHFFGPPRRSGGSHLIFKTGLREPALVNIQPQGKMAKAYQCRQVAAAVRVRKQEGS
jgi:hypothetical protein